MDTIEIIQKERWRPGASRVAGCWLWGRFKSERLPSEGSMSDLEAADVEQKGRPGHLWSLQSECPSGVHIWGCLFGIGDRMESVGRWEDGPRTAQGKAPPSSPLTELCCHPGSLSQLRSALRRRSSLPGRRCRDS